MGKYLCWNATVHIIVSLIGLVGFCMNWPVVLIVCGVFCVLSFFTSVVRGNVKPIIRWAFISLIFFLVFPSYIPWWYCVLVGACFENIYGTLRGIIFFRKALKQADDQEEI